MFSRTVFATALRPFIPVPLFGMVKMHLGSANRIACFERFEMSPLTSFIVAARSFAHGRLAQFGTYCIVRDSC